MTRVALLAVSFALGLSAAAPAAGMGREAYQAHRAQLDAEYDAAIARCKPQKGHARDLCKAQAQGVRDVARAELELRHHPSPRNDEKLRMARAEAVHAMAREKCEALERDAREVCRKDAKAVFAAARADAKVQKELAEAAPRPDPARHRRETVAQKQADAQFAAARERCDMLQPGEMRETCLQDVRRRFGRL